jgi:hypothetical protein
MEADADSTLSSSCGDGHWKVVLDGTEQPGGSTVNS